MKRQRPGSVLTLGILHLIGGTLGLGVAGCAGLNVSLIIGMKNQIAASPDPAARLEVYLQQVVPGYVPFLASVVGVRLILCLMLLSAGIGLLMMQQWARIVSLAYAVLSVGFKLIYAVFYLFIIWPKANTFIQQEGIRLGGAAGSDWALGARMGFLGSVIFNIVLILYPIVVFVVLLLPSVASAFRQPAKRQRENNGDEDEDWGERTRRSEREEDDWPRGRDQDEDDEERDRGRGRFRSR